MLQFAERSITYDTTTDQPMVACFATLSLGPHFTKHSRLCLVNPAALLWLLYYSRNRLLLNLLDVPLYVHNLYNVQQDWKIITNGEWVYIWKEAYLKTPGRYSCDRTELAHVKRTLYGSPPNMRGKKCWLGGGGFLSALWRKGNSLQKQDFYCWISYLFRPTAKPCLLVLRSNSLCLRNRLPSCIPFSHLSTSILRRKYCGPWKGSWGPLFPEHFHTFHPSSPSSFHANY